MKWRKETQVYMFAHYYSDDGNWKAYDESKLIPGSGRKVYNPETRKYEKADVWKHYWKLENLITGEIVEKEFRTLTEAKKYAEA